MNDKEPQTLADLFGQAHKALTTPKASAQGVKEETTDAFQRDANLFGRKYKLFLAVLHAEGLDLGDISEALLFEAFLRHRSPSK